MSDKEVVSFSSGATGSEEWSPDIVVGVDFGMTYTGNLSFFFLFSNLVAQLTE
jgi:hypothetical protein